MRLYSVQPRFVYDVLCRDGIFLARPLRSGEQWFFADAPAAQRAYEWLCDEMVRRGLPRPAADVFPVWAWYHYMGSGKPKPDLRFADLKAAAAAGRHVLLSLDVPDQDVLLHDFDAWHYPLNYWYFSTQRANARFERRCKAAGCPLYEGVPLADARLHQELLSSWQIIFDLRSCRRRLQTAAAKQQIQATFWELRAAHVVAVIEFGQGMSRIRLPLPFKQLVRPGQDAVAS